MNTIEIPLGTKLNVPENGSGVRGITFRSITSMHPMVSPTTGEPIYRIGGSIDVEYDGGVEHREVITLASVRLEGILGNNGIKSGPEIEVIARRR